MQHIRCEQGFYDSGRVFAAYLTIARLRLGCMLKSAVPSSLPRVFQHAGRMWRSLNGFLPRACANAVAAFPGCDVTAWAVSWFLGGKFHTPQSRRHTTGATHGGTTRFVTRSLAWCVPTSSPGHPSHTWRPLPRSITSLLRRGAFWAPSQRASKPLRNPVERICLADKHSPLRRHCIRHEATDRQDSAASSRPSLSLDAMAS